MRWLLLFLVVLNVALYLHEKSKVPIAAPGPVIDGAQHEPIQLLSEAVLPSRREQAPQSANACFFLGGFDDEADATAVQQRLLSLDINASVEAIDMSAGVDYWVYLPPLVSRQASMRELRELQSMNIDSYLITVGELANGISLGIFSRRDSAESVASYMHGVDYAAQIKELPRTHRRYWVMIAVDSYDLFDTAILDGLLRDFPALEHQQMPCTGIATHR